MSTPYMCGDDKAVYVPEAGCDCNYNLVEVSTDQYAHLYQLTLNGDARGDQIIVPLDIRVSDAEIVQVTTAGSPYSGAVVGDWYLHLTVTNGSDLYSALPTAKSLTVTLTVAGWSSNAQTVTATGVTSSNNVIVSPAPSYITAYTEAGIVCTAQGANSLTFTCETVPTENIIVNVIIL